MTQLLVAGASGGAVIAQGVAVSPSLLYISQSGSAGIAIGANVVSPVLFACGFPASGLGRAR